MSETTVTCPLCGGQGEIPAGEIPADDRDAAARIEARRALARERLAAGVEQLRERGLVFPFPDDAA